MSRLFLMFELRYLPLVMAIVLSAAFAVALAAASELRLAVDRLRRRRLLPARSACTTSAQKPSAVLRNYPIAAHLRFIFEAIRPEMRQYFFEDEKDGTAVQPRQARRRLPARQERARRAAVRHQLRRLSRRASNG